MVESLYFGSIKLPDMMFKHLTKCNCGRGELAPLICTDDECDFKGEIYCKKCYEDEKHDHGITLINAFCTEVHSKWHQKSFAIEKMKNEMGECMDEHNEVTDFLEKITEKEKAQDKLKVSIKNMQQSLEKFKSEVDEIKDRIMVLKQEYKTLEIIKEDSKFSEIEEKFKIFESSILKDQAHENIYASYKKILPYIAKHKADFRELSAESKEALNEMRFQYLQEQLDEMKNPAQN